MVDVVVYQNTEVDQRIITNVIAYISSEFMQHYFPSISNEVSYIRNEFNITGIRSAKLA